MEEEDLSDEFRMHPHLQIRAKPNNEDNNDFGCEISYYNEQGNFLGLDECFSDLNFASDRDIAHFSQ